MRITNGSDPVFDKLVTGKDKYLFNLLYRIREDPGSFLATDDSTCIRRFLRSVRKSPLI